MDRCLGFKQEMKTVRHHTQTEKDTEKAKQSRVTLLFTKSSLSLNNTLYIVQISDIIPINTKANVIIFMNH